MADLATPPGCKLQEIGFDDIAVKYECPTNAASVCYASSHSQYYKHVCEQQQLLLLLLLLLNGPQAREHPAGSHMRLMGFQCRGTHQSKKQTLIRQCTVGLIRHLWVCSTT